MARRIHDVAGLSDADVSAVLERAGLLARGASPAQVPAVVALYFGEASLRTRVGFEIAARTIGATPLLVGERRASDRSVPERLEDTLRVVSGYADALVVRSIRPSKELAKAARDDRAWLNAGDSREHPSQALIDLFAIESLHGPVGGAHLAIVGDLRMRAVASLLALLERRPPASLTLISHERLGAAVPPGLVALTRSVRGWEVDGVDVLYAAGIPDRAIPDDQRRSLRVGAEALDVLSPGGIVLSPMPVIDEIAARVRDDPRMRYFEQSDLGLFVRIALLELLLG